MNRLLLILLAATPSYGPTTKDQTQLSTGKAGAQWFNLPDCAPDGGVHLNYRLDGGFVCATAGSGGITTAPGTPTYSVQYNNVGAFGGASNVKIDGGNLVLVGMVNAHPPPPGGTNHRIVYDWLAATGMPTQAMSIDNAMGLPQPAGLMSPFSLFGTAANWRVTGCRPVGFGTANIDEIGATTGALCSVIAGSCTASAPTWSSTNLYTRSPVTLSTKTAVTAANVWCGHHYIASPSIHFWRGINAGEGGFFFWTRVYFVTSNNDGLSVAKTFVGILNVAAVPSASVEPSTYDNVAYFGHDTNSGSVTTLNFCTNDGSGDATCEALGVNFPTVSGSWYDFYIWAPPAASSIYAAVVRLDSAQNSGLLTKSTNLPDNTLQYTWAAMLGSTAADAGPVAIANGGALTLWNY